MILKLIWALLSLLVVYWVYHAIVFYRLVQVSKQLVAKAVPFSVERSGGRRLLVLGDSSAVGVGASSPEHTTAGYFAAEFKDFSVDNRAVSGARMANVLGQATSTSGHYDMVLIQAGGNDTINFTNLDTLRTQTRTLLAAAKERSSNVVMLSTGNLGRAPLFNFFPLNIAFTSRTKAVRQIVMDEAKQAGVTYVDLYKEGKDDVIAQDTAKYYAPDGLHLSDQGWAYWYSQIQQTLPSL